MFNLKQKGFTLLELLIVIAVVGVLAGIVAVAIDPAGKMAKARDVQRKQDVKSIAEALEEYYVFFQEYPVLDSMWENTCDTSRGVSSSGDCVIMPAGSNWAANTDLTELVTGGYIKKLPLDPTNAEKNGAQYYYRYEPETSSALTACGTGWPSSKGCRFVVGAILEKPTIDTEPIFKCTSKGVCKESSSWSW